ncbi:G-D-S-L family lipolytic protein [Mariniflexile sp.]|uniref:G-D-S-L family lipolytic protein n=1 Tax=Mariniflexile sp. TaxID=1979402 RepID=UPI004048D6CA
MNTRYIFLLLLLIGFFSCNEEDTILPKEVVLPELTSGSADFSKYVAVGASFTAGFTDNALFKAAQQNSFPNILSKEFAKIGGTAFTQPLTNDNYGGLAAGGSRIPGFEPRLVFGGAGPVALETVIGPITVSTDILTNKPTGPFTNMGVPGAKSFHLLFNGYGNPANLATQTANPYFIRMASSPTATILGDAMVQKPTFFTLSEIGGNDVLGFAVSGGDGTNTITPSAGPPGVGFDQTFATLVTTLTAGGVKGVVTNVPYITDLPHFTTVPYNAVPLDAATAAQLNAAFAAYNAGLQNVLNGINAGLIPAAAAPNFNQAEVDKRKVNFVAGKNAVLILDETLSNLTGINAALTNMRQATAADLLVLPSMSFIGTTVGGNPQLINGVSVPLADKWVLLPSEQVEIKAATDAYNASIAAVASSNPNIALVDLNGILTQLATTGVKFNGFTLKANLVTGGAIGLDGIHLNARGYAYMANKFLEAIDAKFGSNFVASGSIAKAADYPTNYSPALK